MKFVKNFISFVSVVSLFWMMSCSSFHGDSTDISISFNVNALKNTTAKVMQNAGSVSDGEGDSVASDELYNAKLSVTLYEITNAENIPSDYESFDKSLYNEISFSSCYADKSGNMTVTLSAVPIGMKAIIVAEITAENENVQEVMFAGISKVFEVLPEKNIVDLELKSTQKEPVIQKFTLKFILSNQTEKQISNIESGSSINIADKVILDGYNVKFYEDENYSNQITDTEIVINSDVTIYVKLEAITYSITYELNEGTWADGFNYEKSYTIESAANFSLPTSEHLTKQGFVFEGWYDNAEYTGTAITNLAGKTGNITLYAKWRNENQVPTVQFSHAAGGVDKNTAITLSCETVGATIYYTLDESVPTDITNSARNEYKTDGTIIINAKTTIKAYAVYEGMTDSDVSTVIYTLNVYTLNFDANGGTLPSDMQSSVPVTSGDTYDFSKNVPTKTGYNFQGWYLSTNPDATENSIAKYAPNIENTSNKTKTFYAKWEPITYTVIFYPNGGSEPPTYPTQTFTYDVAHALNPNQFTREGYTFTGWNTVEAPTTENPGVSYIDKQSVKNLTTNSESIILYAQWQANKATITVTMPEYTDISELTKPTDNNNGTLTFTAPSEYTNYNWYVDGVEQTTTSSNANSWTFDTSNYNGGIYTIMLVVEDSNGNKYSAEWQVTVTK